MLVPMLFAIIFGFFAFRSRIKGVYFAIITQALAFAAWLVFNRNDTSLGGTNGLTDFKQVLGFRLSDPSTQRGLYILTVLVLAASYLLCRWIIASRAGKVLIAIRDSESRVTFSGYTPWTTNSSSLSWRQGWLDWRGCCMRRRSASSHRRRSGSCRRLKWSFGWRWGAGHLGRGNLGGRDRELRPQRVDELFPGTLAVYPRRTLCGGGDVVSGWTGGHDRKVDATKSRRGRPVMKTEGIRGALRTADLIPDLLIT